MRWYKLSKFIKCFFIFISFELILTTFWIIYNYDSNATLNAIIFHLALPFNGVNHIFFYSYAIFVLIPSVLLAIISIFYLKNISLFLLLCSVIILIYGFNDIYNFFINLPALYYQSFLFDNNINIIFFIKLLVFISIISLVLFIFVFILNLIPNSHIYIFISFVLIIFVVNKHFLISDLLKPKQYSLFYEENYEIPNVYKNTKLRNLIIIFAESIESTFYNGGGYNLIPNLYNLARENIYFSDNGNFGGITQSVNTSWTIAGIVGYLCGIPLSLPIDSSIIYNGNFMQNYYFLKNATCISDVLYDMNYKQTALIGYDTSFAGYKYFFKTHHIDIIDINDLQNRYKIEYGFWGAKDAQAFKFAKDYLLEYDFKKPLALYLRTSDTHYPGGFIDKEYCKNIENINNDMDSARRCSDKIIYDFVSWAKKQDFYKNTTIVILGDHLSASHFNYQNRKIYNTFINAKFSKQPITKLTHNRLLTHFDITPLILDSIGFRVEYFGLGRNPLYDKTLLEKYDLKEINDLILQDSRLYRSFWE